MNEIPNKSIFELSYPHLFERNSFIEITESLLYYDAMTSNYQTTTKIESYLLTKFRLIKNSLSRQLSDLSDKKTSFSRFSSISNVSSIFFI